METNLNDAATAILAIIYLEFGTALAVLLGEVFFWLKNRKKGGGF